MMIPHPFAWHFQNSQPDLQGNLASQQDGMVCVVECAAAAAAAVKPVHKSRSLWVTRENHPWETGQTQTRIRGKQIQVNSDPCLSNL